MGIQETLLGMGYVPKGVAPNIGNHKSRVSSFGN